MEELGGEKNQGGDAGAWDVLAEEAASAERLANLRKAIKGAEKNDIASELQQKTRDAVAEYENRLGREITRGEMQAIMRAEPSYYGLVQRDAEGNQFNSAGKVCEKGLTGLIIDEFGYKEEKSGIFSSKKRDESTRESTIAEDVLEGADVMIFRLPVDITLNAGKGGEIGSVDENGEVSEGFRKVGNVGGVRISSGFRMTNGARRLETPVCVMLFEGEERMHADEMVSVLKKYPEQFRDIADEALASYWDYADAMEDAA
ncbi:MAG: hypothetical protein ACK5MU_04535 [Candidatus Saccharimonadales bacterium]